MAKALKGNKSLKKLKLAHNDIGPEGGAALAEVLGFTKIKWLALDTNRIGDVS